MLETVRFCETSEVEPVERGAFAVLRSCLELLEANRRWRCVLPGEPQLSSRGLYPTTSFVGSADSVATMLDVIAYCDGDHDLVDLAERSGAPAETVADIVQRLEAAGVIEEVPKRKAPDVR